MIGTDLRIAQSTEAVRKASGKTAKHFSFPTLAYAHVLNAGCQCFSQLTRHDGLQTFTFVIHSQLLAATLDCTTSCAAFSAASAIGDTTFQSLDTMLSIRCLDGGTCTLIINKFSWFQALAFPC